MDETERLLRIRIVILERAVEALQGNQVRMELRQMLLKACVGWKEGEKVPLPEDVLTGIREYAKELGMTV